MRIELAPGEELIVTLQDSDGEFTISFDKDDDKCVKIEADMPDTEGREGVIYCEDFSASPDDKANKPVVEPAKKWTPESIFINVLEQHVDVMQDEDFTMTEEDILKARWKELGVNLDSWFDIIADLRLATNRATPKHPAFSNFDSKSSVGSMFNAAKEAHMFRGMKGPVRR